jgi:hypothetical protein
MGVKKEIWTGEAIRQFTHSGEFLSEVPDQSRYVDNDVIHLVELGVKPEVLINNTTYPIPVQESEDGDITISLDKFQTLQSEVSDDDLESASYQIIAEKSLDHVDALEEVTGDKAAHALAPQLNTVLTPIIVTTGAENEAGQKALMQADVIALKKAFDTAGIPKKGRVLVLCSQHIADLLNTSEAFVKQYKDIQEGTIVPILYGFKIYEHANCPKYYQNVAAWTKRAFAAAPVAGDREASFAFYGPRMFKAKGTMKFYSSEGKNNPATQANYFNYRLRFIALPKTQEGIAAIVSPDAA